MEITSNGLDYELTNEEFMKLNKMCIGIARRRQGWSRLTAEDLTDDLWIKAMELIRSNKSCANQGTINFKWIGRCLWNKVIDICRSAKRTNDRQFAATEFMDAFVKEMSSDTAKKTGSPLFEDDHDSAVNIQAILNLFVPGSREHQYVRLVALHVGAGDCLGKAKFKEKRNEIFGDKRMELEVAVRLGYASDTSNGYRNLRSRVRKSIVEAGLKGRPRQMAS